MPLASPLAFNMDYNPFNITHSAAKKAQQIDLTDKNYVAN